MAKVQVLSTSIVAIAVGIALGSLYSHNDRPIQTPKSNREYVKYHKSAGISDKIPSTIGPPDPTKGFELVIENNGPNGSVISVFYWNAGEEKEILMSEVESQKLHKVITYYDHIFVIRRRDDGHFMRSIVANPDVKRELAFPDESAANDYYERTGIKWNNVFNRGPASHRFIGSNNVGDSITIDSAFNHWLGENEGFAEMSLQLELTTRSLEPRIVIIENFLSAAECDHIIEQARIVQNYDGSTGFTRSRTGAGLGDVNEVRTSSNTWIDVATSDQTKRIAGRMFEVIGIKFSIERVRAMTEIFQVLEYDAGQFYKNHHDWWDPHHEQNAHDKKVLKGRNRFATFFLYLSDVEGGETAFPKALGNETTGYVLPEEACESGLKIKPRKGSAVVFYSMMPDGNLDDRSLHVGCPVKSGIKYAANAWIWDPTRDDLD